ncbi:PIN domain-containing protein [Actinomadura sp. NPDC023710]|uniref:PIN domain-containing protein n=1 Tax=Actinomadura sp. NPDC023710 TaxID=3158219 RepID=UPI003404397F
MPVGTARRGRLEEWDLAVPMGLAERESLHIAIPLVVVEELDRLKESGKKHTRWRAGYTTAVINRVLPDSNEIGVLREAGYALGRGTITLEVLMDGPATSAGRMRTPRSSTRHSPSMGWRGRP